jgi:hypothetical protein
MFFNEKMYATHFIMKILNIFIKESFLFHLNFLDWVVSMAYLDILS